MSTPSKRALKDELVQKLRSDLDTLTRAHEAALEGATHEDARPENDKDTRALEQSYLARGQAARIEELRAGLGATEGMLARDFAEGAIVAVGALVTVEEDDAEKHLFLAPHGGGIVIAGGTIAVVTPRSPLGRALLGKEVGDECEIPLEGKTRVIAIAAIR